MRYIIPDDLDVIPVSLIPQQGFDLADQLFLPQGLMRLEQIGTANVTPDLAAVIVPDINSFILV
jgi:hypothetical protein